MRRIPTLDGWRAVAILAVIWHHAAMGLFSSEAAYYQTAARFGAFGVDLFFGLSGMLITGLLLKEWDETGTVSLKAFYIRRAFRILPVYLFFLSVVTIAGLASGSKELASCLLFFRNYVSVDGPSRDTGHLWSLSVEEHFYLFWPGLLMLVGGKFGRRAARKTAAGLALGFGLWRLVESQMTWHLFPGAPPHFRSDLRMDALLWGAVVAFTLQDSRDRERFREQIRIWAWLVMVALALVAGYYYSTLTSIWLAVLIPMILAGTALHPEWPLSRFLDLAPAAWIGRISYSLYIWQQLFMVPGWENPAHLWTRYPWNLAAVLLVATASYYLLEVPLLKLGRRMARRFSVRSDESIPVAEEVAMRSS